MAVQGFQDPQTLVSECEHEAQVCADDDDIFRDKEYRQLILSIAQDLGNSDIEKLAYQQALRTAEFKSAIQVLRYLEQRDRIGPHKLSNLSTMLKAIHREDLVSKMIEPFQQKFPVPLRYRETKLSSQTSLLTRVSLNDTEISENMPLEGTDSEQEFSSMNSPTSFSQVQQETGNPSQGQLSLSQHSNMETLKHELRMPSLDKMYISNSNTNSSVNLSFEDTGSQYIRSQETYYSELNVSSYSSPDFPSSECSDPLHLKRSSSSGFGDQKKATNSVSSSSPVSEYFLSDKKHRSYASGPGLRLLSNRGSELFSTQNGNTGFKRTTMNTPALPLHEESHWIEPSASERLKTGNDILCLGGVSKQSSGAKVSLLEHQSTAGVLSNTGELVINEQPGLARPGGANPMGSAENVFYSGSGSGATVAMSTCTIDSAENVFQSSSLGSSATIAMVTKSTHPMESTLKASQSTFLGSDATATTSPIELAEKASCSGSSATVTMSKKSTTPNKDNDHDDSREKPLESNTGGNSAAVQTTSHTQSGGIDEDSSSTCQTEAASSINELAIVRGDDNKESILQVVQTQVLGHPSPPQKILQPSLPTSKTAQILLIEKEVEVPSAPLSFIKPVKLLHITTEGGKYIDSSLGLRIEVPEGAVADGCKLDLEVGMCLHSPFTFPSDSVQIAPVLMLYPHKKTSLKKSIKLTLPHTRIINKAASSEKEAFDIYVTKAYHSTRLPSEYRYSFKDISREESQIVLYQEDTKSYVSFSLSHFCFVSLRDAISREKAKTYGYCMCVMQPSQMPASLGDFSYFLALTFNMEPCIEELQQLFKEKNFRFLEPEIVQAFSLDGKKDCIQASICSLSVNSGWKASMTRANEEDIQTITADSIDIWSKEKDVLARDIKHGNYPPSFQVMVIGREANESSFVKIKFKTNMDGNFWLTLPLLTSHQQLPSALSKSQPQISPGAGVKKPLTLKKLQRSKGLSDSQLDQELDSTNMPSLAVLFDNPEYYVAKFGLSPADSAHVENEKSTRSAMCKALQLWQESQPYEATYKNLIEITLSLGKAMTAVKVCDFCAGHVNND